MDPLTRRLKSNERGNVMIEFALVLPILILLAVGTMDLARAVYAYAVISNAARDGAHYASLNPRIVLNEYPGNCCVGDFDRDLVLQRMWDKDFTALDKNNVRADVICTINDEPDHPRDVSNPCTSWNFVYVTVLYEFKPITALVPSFTMTTQSTMTIE